MGTRDFTLSTLHAELDQKERDLVMREFRGGSSPVLLTTDSLARGIDIQAVDFVINCDVPDTPEVYVHQVGRAGRFGRKAAAISFVIGDEADFLTEVTEQYGPQFIELPLDFDTLLD